MLSGHSSDAVMNVLHELRQWFCTGTCGVSCALQPTVAPASGPCSSCRSHPCRGLLQNLTQVRPSSDTHAEGMSACGRKSPSYPRGKSLCSNAEAVPNHYLHNCEEHCYS